MAKKGISIIIVNYKSWSHLKNCLEAIDSIENEQFNLETIVVDNCSDDGQLPQFINQFKKVYFFNNSGNNGFANGCNFGAEKAIGDYFLFLNPDAIINKITIEKLLEEAKKHQEYGVLSCLQKNSSGKAEKIERFFPSLSTLFGWSRAVYKKINHHRIKKQYPPDSSVVFPDWVSGSLVFISKYWFQKIGGWNEDYFMYYEDVDLCKKVKIHNGVVALFTDKSIIHNHGGASRINFKTTSLTKTEVIISKHVYVQNHFKGLNKIITQTILLIVNIITNFSWSLVGTIFFFIPKLKLKIYIFKQLILYYIHCISNRTWLSSRSMNFK
ncbi:MAG: glycosyltransferase family 2 protein [Lutibacter sp.]